MHIDFVIEGLKANPELQLVAIAETDPKRRAHWASLLGVPAYESWQELLEKERLEAAAVVCEYGERAPASIACLERGIHVICDKPVAISPEQLDGLEEAYANGQAAFSCLLEKRFWGPYRVLKELVTDGRLGQIVSAVATGPHKLMPEGRPGWMFQESTYGGTLVDLVVHDIDALLWLCGGTPTMVRAAQAQRRWQEAGDLQDTGQVFFRTDNGLTAFVDVNWLTPTAAPWHGDYRLMLNGTHGSATVRYVGRELMVVTDRDGVLPLAVPPDENPFDDFAHAILRGTTPSIAAADIFRATRFTLLARRSAELDRELKLDPQLRVTE